MQVDIFASTDKGKTRAHNEDYFYCVLPNGALLSQPIHVLEKGVLLLVADGMGGTNAGEIAAQIAVETIHQRFHQTISSFNTDPERVYFLQTLLMDAHKGILRHAKRHPECANMGTTVVIAWLMKDAVYIAWCGDSRAYMYRHGQPFQRLTQDHSVVWAEVLKGNLTEEQARLHPNSHILSQSLGNAAYTPQPDGILYPLKQGDRLILCSDGLNSMLSDTQLEQILLENKTSNPAILNAALIQAANQAGGYDNITVITTDITLLSEKKGQMHRIPKLKQRLLGLTLASFLGLGSWYYYNLPQPLSRKPKETAVKDMGVINYKQLKELKTDTQAVLLKQNIDTITQIVDLRLNAFGNKVSDLYKKHHNNRVYIKLNRINQNIRKEIKKTFESYGYLIGDNGQVQYIGMESIKPIPSHELERLRQQIEKSKQEIDKLLTF